MIFILSSSMFLFDDTRSSYRCENETFIVVRAVQDSTDFVRSRALKKANF